MLSDMTVYALIVGLAIWGSWGVISCLSENIGEDKEMLERLYNDLAQRRVLNTKLGPLPPGRVVNINVGLAVQLVHDVNEARQTITSLIVLNITWQDQDLTWNMEDYGNWSCVSIPSKMIWLVDMYYASSTNPDSGKLVVPETLKLTSDGTINFVSWDIVESFCDFDVKYYPLDTQACKFSVSFFNPSIGLNASVSYLEKHDDATDIFHINGEWKLLDVTWRKLEVPTILNIELTIIIRRESLYYILCVLMPMVSTSLLTLIVFWIPPDSGERVSYLVSISSSTTVFLGFISGAMPRNMSTATNTPRMMLFLAYVIIENASVIAANVYVMRVYEREKLARRRDKIVDPAAKADEESRRVAKSRDESLGKEASLDEVKPRRLCRVKSQLLNRVSSMVGLNANGESAIREEEAGDKTKKISAMKWDMILFWSFLVASVPFYALVFSV